VVQPKSMRLLARSEEYKDVPLNLLSAEEMAAEVLLRVCLCLICVQTLVVSVMSGGSGSPKIFDGPSAALGIK
jgi:hypothetical protein